MLFRASRDRSGDHAEEHLKSFTGILQADAYAGYNRLLAPDRQPGPIVEALCWAHARRKFFELADIATSRRRGRNAAPISPIAFEAVTRIDALFDIEPEINSMAAEQRLAVRRERSAPLVADLEAWASIAPSSRGMRPSPRPWTICFGAGMASSASSAMAAFASRTMLRNEA